MIGDQDDVTARLRQLLPPWFGLPGDSPVLDSLMEGAAWALSLVYGIYAFAKLQTRIATATGGWLDLASGDFFGQALRRFGGELDSIYSRRIRLEVFRDRNTRNGIDRAVFDLTSNHPAIFEAYRPADCGGWGTSGLAWGVVGAYGSSQAPFQVLITTPPPRGYGIPNRPGLDDPAAGIEFTLSLASDADIIANGPTQADVLAALERVRSAGVTYYVLFQDPAPAGAPEYGVLDFSDPNQSQLLPVI